jgi:hypothetical protein
MSKLVAWLRHDFPEYNYINTFEAAIPAYSIQLSLEVLQQQELTTFQSYILHLLSLDVKSLESMGYYLGVDKEVLLSSIAGLVKLQYVEQGNALPGQEDRLLFLTDRGRVAVEKGNPLPVPTRKIGKFLFNALTWSAVSPGEDFLYADEVDKLGLFVLPPKETDRPTLGTFSENDVKSVLKDEPAFKDTKIVGLLKLKEVSSRYFAPASVVVLQHRTTNEKTVAIYRNSTQQRPETEALQRLLEASKFEIPSLGTPLQLQEQEIQIPSSLPKTTAEEIQQVMHNERLKGEIITRVEENKIRKTATQDAREREELEQKLIQLQEELQGKNKDINLLCQQLRQSKVEFLRTEQNRAKLLQAIKEAEQEVIIISPWMNRTACDNQLCELFGNAISRGVRIHIGYGMGYEHDFNEASTNSSNVRAVTSAIRKYVRGADATRFLSDIVKTTGTHQKILVCDRRFAITGSFNWLSYAGKRDNRYREELGVLFRHIDQVNELAEIAMRVWSSSQ